jgi:hypothetical protein
MISKLQNGSGGIFSEVIFGTKNNQPCCHHLIKGQSGHQ